MQGVLIWSWKAAGFMLFSLLSHIARKCRCAYSERKCTKQALWYMAAEYFCYVMCVGILFG